MGRWRRAARYLSGPDEQRPFDVVRFVRLQRGPDMTEQHDKPGSIGAQPGDASAAHDAQAVQTQAEFRPVSQQARKTARKRKLLAAGGLAVVGLAGLLVFGIPWIGEMLNTVSTDDAYVNGHVTFVAARVRGQVARVLVDDNNRVHKGDILVELDKEPYQDAVDVSKAAVDTAKANLLGAIATVRSVEAEARSRRWKLQSAIEDVANQVALLRARVAALDKNKAGLTLAQADFDRASKVVATGAVSRSVFDERQAALLVARAQVTQALADVYQIRASLGLPAVPEGGDLASVPPDIEQNFSSVRQAQADLIHSAAQLGIVHSYNQTPKQMLEQFEKQGDIDRTFARYVADAPAVKEAEAKLEAANRDLAQAELSLRYCDIVAAIDGVVTRRNVNPGDDVQVGQSLMAIRSLRDIWVDANFKETQLRYLRIGQAADLYVDMYGNSRVFKGRVSGFTMGTGSTLALLPAQNATGNFIKVVQRLPVRIDVEDYDPDKYPLFYGASVVPYVHVKRAPTGPNAGKFLQTYVPPSSVAGSVASSSGAGQ
jgi:membrane fusion protein (multidrug efflux system)